MRVVIEGKEPFTTLWCNFSLESSEYRWMKYIVKTDIDIGKLILNIVTGELILLYKDEDFLSETFNVSYTPETDYLIKHRFLVPVWFDELYSVLQLRKIVRCLNFNNPEINSYTILPTTTCNARCFYCYENDYPRHTMNQEIADLLLDFISDHCSDNKSIHLSWFGGEPTIGEQWIDYICYSLTERGFSFSSSMVSNGYLFTRDMVHKAKEKWKLSNIQITLDGTEIIYNRVKSYVNVLDNPFRRVMDNIGYLLDKDIYVAVRVNIDKYNSNDVYKLIDELSENFSSNRYFSVYVHEIFEDVGYEPIQRSSQDLDEIIRVKHSVEDYLDLKGILHKKDVKGLPFLKTSFCMADNPKSLLINPIGQIGKCQHMQFSHLIGDLHNLELMEKDQTAYWMDYKPNKECSECSLFPFCGVPLNCIDGRACTTDETFRKIEKVRKKCLDQYLKKSEVL